jgi:hypothetical protein
VLQLPAVATEVLETGEIPTEVGALNKIKFYYIICSIINEKTLYQPQLRSWPPSHEERERRPDMVLWDLM